MKDWDQCIVVWTLRNREDDRIITVTRTVHDRAPCDNDWYIEAVDYINVESE